MISLSELKAYIKAEGMQGEEQIARHFQTTPAVIAMMAEKLASKGSVRLVTSPGFPGATSALGAVKNTQHSVPGAMSQKTEE